MISEILVFTRHIVNNRGGCIKLVIARKEEDPAVCSRGGDDLTKVVLKRRVCWPLSEDKLMPQKVFGKLFL
jgi:hypothetical protein